MDKSQLAQWTCVVLDEVEDVLAVKLASPCVKLATYKLSLSHNQPILTSPCAHPDLVHRAILVACIHDSCPWNVIRAHYLLI